MHLTENLNRYFTVCVLAENGYFCMFNMHVTVIVKAKRLLNYTKNELSENDTPGDFILVEGQNLLYRLQDCAVL